MVEGKKWFLKSCSRNLQTCATAQAYLCSPYPQHNQETIKKNLIRSKGTRCDFRHSEYMSTPPVVLIHSPKTLKYPPLINLWSFHSNTQKTNNLKDNEGNLWLVSYLSQDKRFDYSLQSFPPSLPPPLIPLFLFSSRKYRAGQKWPCKDLNLWLKALIWYQRPTLSGLGDQSPWFWPRNLCCFSLVQDEGFCLCLSMRLAESRPVIMVNKTCWSYYGEERSNYNCLKQY